MAKLYSYGGRRHWLSCLGTMLTQRKVQDHLLPEALDCNVTEYYPGWQELRLDGETALTLRDFIPGAHDLTDWTHLVSLALQLHLLHQAKYVHGDLHLGQLLAADTDDHEMLGWLKAQLGVNFPPLGDTRLKFLRILDLDFAGYLPDKPTYPPGNSNR